MQGVTPPGRKLLATGADNVTIYYLLIDIPQAQAGTLKIELATPAFAAKFKQQLDAQGEDLLQTLVCHLTEYKTVNQMVSPPEVFQYCSSIKNGVVTKSVTVILVISFVTPP